MSLKNKLLVILLVLVLIPVTALATGTRVTGLGGWPGANYVVKDAVNPVHFPSTLAYYPGLLYAEFKPNASYTSLSRIGAWYGLGEGNVVGFDIFNKTRTDYTALPAVPSRLSLRWARPFGDIILGAALGIYHDSQEKTGDTLYTDTTAIFQEQWSTDDKGTILGLDLGVTALDNNLDLALSFEFPSGTRESDGLYSSFYEVNDTCDATTDGKHRMVIEDDGSSMLRFAARYWHHYGERTTLIPNFELTTTKNAYTELYTSNDSTMYESPWYPNPTYTGGQFRGSQDFSVTSTVVRLGLGHNWKPAKSVLVVFDIGVRFQSIESEWKSDSTSVFTQWGPIDTVSTEYAREHGTDGTTDWTDMPYWRLGWEGRVFKWLKLRGGAEKIWRSSDEDEKSHHLDPHDTWDGRNHYTRKTGGTVTNMYFGGDLNFGPVTIQYLLDQDFVRRGPYFISGSPGSIFHRFSLFYKIPK